MNAARNGLPAKPAAINYPQEDFVPIVPRIAECEIEVRTVDLTPGRWLRTWRYFRKLIRRRQETSALREVRKDCEARITGVRMESARAARQHSEKCQGYERRIAELESSLKSTKNECREMEEVDIPRLRNEIRVLESHIELLEAVNTKSVSKIEKDIAIYDAMIVNAETAGHEMRGATRQ